MKNILLITFLLLTTFLFADFIDASALGTLDTLIARLRDAGVTLHMAEVKGPVMDKLQLVDFEETLGDGKVYLSTHQAMADLKAGSSLKAA